MNMAASILIVEDEPIIAADIESTLIKNDFHVVGIAYNSTQAIDKLAAHQIDLVLMDIAVKGDKDGIQIAGIIKNKYAIPVVYITSYSDKETLERAKMTMPYGYIVKPFKDKDILSTVEIALYRYAMDHPATALTKNRAEEIASQVITDSEFRILILLWEGKSNKSIAAELFVSVNTVKTHIKNIFQKFNVSNRTELVAKLR